MNKTIMAVLILVPATFLTGCVTQRTSYSSGYNSDYLYKRSNSSTGNLGVVSYGLDFGKGYGINYGPDDYGNGDYANCKYGNCDYAYHYGNSNYGLGYGSGDDKFVDYDSRGRSYSKRWRRPVGVDRWHNGTNGWYSGSRWHEGVRVLNR
ncbi:hypothetical protein TUM19329_21280 [Legionella antarctica]|uniref:Lipoprotein n=1 Tax=Legionella antarctica TaxID=2708020 RepID=A0A6F8T6I9_9GAMM|nr:hypothetical protein [Legionella antarctica]BCA95767.1 hypothetical protein TUM19329_21280 [Legionella antarctica]